MFGALKSCPMCSGHLSYSGSTYKCHGFISEWSKCSYSTTQPERIKGKWKIPEESDNQYLVKVPFFLYIIGSYGQYWDFNLCYIDHEQWFKSQKAAKPVRILPPSTPNTSAGNQTAKEQLKSSKDEKLGDLRVAITGLPKETVVYFFLLCSTVHELLMNIVKFKIASVIHLLYLFVLNCWEIWYRRSFEAKSKGQEARFMQKSRKVLVHFFLIEGFSWWKRHTFMCCRFFLVFDCLYCRYELLGCGWRTEWSKFWIEEGKVE